MKPLLLLLLVLNYHYQAALIMCCCSQPEPTTHGTYANNNIYISTVGVHSNITEFTYYNLSKSFNCVLTIEVDDIQ